MAKKNVLKNKLNNRMILFIVYLILIVLLTSGLIGFMNGSTKSIFGYTFRIVVTGSMEPNIKTNSLNIIKICDIEDIEVGDILCFNYSQDIVHRVVEKTTNSDGVTVLHTKGDANEMPDSIEINSEMVVGKVVKTFNEVASIIDKYSIYPGQIDGISLARTIIVYGLIIGFIVLILSWLVTILSILIKSFKKETKFNKNIDKYIEDIDELILYRELLLELRDKEVENSAETRFAFIGNRLARAKAELEIRNLHYSIKDFKKSIKQCLYINKLGTLMDKEENKEPEQSISDIIKQYKDKK